MSTTTTAPTTATALANRNLQRSSLISTPYALSGVAPHRDGQYYPSAASCQLPDDRCDVEGAPRPDDPCGDRAVVRGFRLLERQRVASGTRGACANVSFQRKTRMPGLAKPTPGLEPGTPSLRVKIR